ncbi:MAG TPA: hypothetical protein QGH10_04210 [Armatimonadota bacterium]|nr:hypothetical protein [Armatimonadota bacterium]
MSPRQIGDRRIYLFLMGLACFPFMGAGCGCEKEETTEGSVSQLRQVRMRYSQDQHGDTCYLVAEVENAGTTPVSNGVATAALKNRRDKEMGKNHHPIGKLQPGERRTFSMTINAHADFRTVELTLHEPEEE